MNVFNRKLKNKIKIHPEMLRNFLSNPNEETLKTLDNFQIFESKNMYLGQLLLSLIPHWEILACSGNKTISDLIKKLKDHRISIIDKEAEFLKSNLLRIRILAETPGKFPFSPHYIQENLLNFLDKAELIADLPQFEVIHFSEEEIAPLAKELTEYRLSPLSRRYVQNLFHPERQEAILSVLAYLAKNYPVFCICRQAYAVMLSLDAFEYWSRNPFILRLIANRFWEFRSKELI